MLPKVWFRSYITILIDRICMEKYVRCIGAYVAWCTLYSSRIRFSMYSKWCLFERRRAKCKQLETRQTRIQMKNQMHKTISQRYLLFVSMCVCGCPCVWASLNFFFLLSTFRLFKLDTLNDLMRFENLTQYDAVCALTFCYSFSSFFIDHKRERNRTNK